MPLRGLWAHPLCVPWQILTLHFLIWQTTYRFVKREWWVCASPKSQKQANTKAEGRAVTANSLHRAIQQHNTGSLFSCTHRCTTAGTLYSPDGKNPYYFDRVWGNWSNEGLWKCAAVIQPRVPRFLPPRHFRVSHRKYRPIRQGGRMFKKGMWWKSITFLFYLFFLF